jgi:hypothetical protein
MSKNIIIVLIYHRHKPLDHIYTVELEGLVYNTKLKIWPSRLSEILKCGTVELISIVFHQIRKLYMVLFFGHEQNKFHKLNQYITSPLYWFHLVTAVAEAVSRWLPTAAARVRARVWQVGFVVDKVASWQVFSEYFGFPCQNRLFHQLLQPLNHPGQTRRGLATS